MSGNQNNAPEETAKTSPVFRAILVLIIGVLIGYFVYATTVHEGSKYPFRLGLDLSGGSHLVYEADTSSVDPSDVPELMNVLKDVIERRVNVFGVSEPIVQVETSSIVSGEQKERLVVELPGVADVDAAIAEIGRTPLLEFKLVNLQAAAAAQLQAQFETSGGNVNVIPEDGTSSEEYIETGLTGRYLKSSELVFGNGTGSLANEPIVSITFTDDGAALFEQITREHTGEQLAIFLDGEVVSAPRINEAISGGKAIISGNFTAPEARELVQNLNFGALPLPIELLSTQTIGASLGNEILQKGVKAGAVGLVLVLAFMFIWYRLPGVVAGIALLMYALIMLALFKFIPVTLTSAGLAGFILSLGMAVDANVLVFERMKEEFRSGKGSREAARIGFQRAWSAIRDGNVTSILSAVILFWFGTSIVKGFALVFGLGVAISMLTALTVTRTLLLALPETKKEEKTLLSRLFGSGFSK
ncbi:protein translocase subunit SecD [Candidatus Kaiserbacteria bacterium CG10_big_fil_rev_8_21_14_0_10_47_16]|uniref:Protein translocase subunit SecD n=1 Tax=Candidatus Kaiserbacteria bacterium CG10_big_fil_rev_8_21_14_0_10_47_16 TaxID=1974608 RepID=A0A2H0UE27_9BACT|nr:MAG: protein translocase subunit SecD [Candidatus Kaiserbacteria bacterium CG10_big_fil_rev_8_21_14_0_10_47_16]